jgi:hypothetical protein
MDETLARLFEAMNAARKTEKTGKSELARLMSVDPQSITNWGARGVPVDVMIDAQVRFGFNAAWLRSGDGPMMLGDPMPSGESRGAGGLADSLKLTCESAAELQMLSVYRLSNQDHRNVILAAVEVARKALRWGGVLDNRQ